MDSLGGIQPQLEEAQRELAKALDEACAVDPEEVDTGELMRIEESLAVAMKAAKQAVSLRLVRRKLRAESKPEPSVAVTVHDVVQHRVFDDYHGIRWNVFAVFPSRAKEPAALPATYRDGWLAFRSEREIRRVAPIPANWNDLSIEELRQLCHKAEVAPKREKPPTA